MAKMQLNILRPSQGFWGTGEQGNLFQGNRGANAIFQGNRGTSSEIWGTGEHKILSANDIKYCYKEPFLEETQNGMVLVTLVLVWCVSGCLNGPNFKTQIRNIMVWGVD